MAVKGHCSSWRRSVPVPCNLVKQFNSWTRSLKRRDISDGMQMQVVSSIAKRPGASTRIVRRSSGKLPSLSWDTVRVSDQNQQWELLVSFSISAACPHVAPAPPDSGRMVPAVSLAPGHLGLDVTGSSGNHASPVGGPESVWPRSGHLLRSPRHLCSVMPHVGSKWD